MTDNPQSPETRWRGYVNMLTYGLRLHKRVEERTVALQVERLIAQRSFTQPVGEFYRAAQAALTAHAQGQTLAQDEHDNDDVIRDYLQRIVALLDTRRPWPQPPFRTVEPQRWSDLMGDAPIIGRIDISRRHLQERLSRVFTRITLNAGTVNSKLGCETTSETDTPTPIDPPQLDVMLLHLRTGQLVGLTTDPATPHAGVFLHAHTHPQTTITEFRQLTDLDAQPA